MSAWWYAAAGEKIGPLTQAEITQRIAAGEIGAQTLLWQAGMDAWQPLADIAELHELPSEESSVVPPTAMPVVDAPASRTRRWLARSFDLLWELFLVSAILGAVLGYYSADFLVWRYTLVGLLTLGFVNVVVALLLDAVLYRVVANTPGKALLGVRVSLADGSRLRFSQYLGRNFRLWLSGLALGLPLLQFFAMGYQFFRLGKGKAASYDAAANYQVRAKAIGGWRKLGFAALLTLPFGLAMVGSHHIQHEAERAEQLADYVWTNPVTGRSAKIDARWKISSQTNSQGQPIYVFSERGADRAAEVLAVEQQPGWTLNHYVLTFRQATAATMGFSDDGLYLVWEGRPEWEASGVMVMHTDQRLHVRVVQVGDNFWRVVTIQAPPYAYSDAQIEPLQTALWRTVLPEAADTQPEAALPPAQGTAPKTSGKTSSVRL